LGLFKANTFFRNFDIKGGGDRLLIYLILYIQECLTKLQKAPNTIEAQKVLQTHAVQSFALPGDASFPLNSMFERPQRQDIGILLVYIETLRLYLTQLRQELSTRLIEKVYEDGTPSKWWMCFAKKKFMGMHGVGTLC
jgi:actin related protein 2/3 complex subunit 3